MIWVSLVGRGLIAADLDRILGWAPGSSLKLLYGDRKPGRHASSQLQKEFGIDPDKFDEAPTKAFIPPGARIKKAVGF